MKSSQFTPYKKTAISVAAASLFMASALSADCTYQLFSISATKGTKVSEFVDQLSDECAFSVIVTDPEAEKMLDKMLNKTKLKNLTIDEVLNLILAENNLAYTLENNVLKISYVQTKTYNIDYIISQRKGEGSTDITLSSQSGTTGGTGATTTTGSTNQSQSESGMKITSTDEVLFWEELDGEILSILNRPEDTYVATTPVVNKAAGLVTVTATAKQLKRLDAYVEELQRKMQYQVLIDVKMYGVVFEDGSKTGIDWNQIYQLQNFTVGFNKIDQQNVDTFEEGLITAMNEGDKVQALTATDGIGTLGLEDIAGARAAVDTTSSLLNLSNSITINDFVKFLNTQGDVYSISNPKVLTLNNQPALITVGTELFYKIVSTETTAGTGATAQSSNEIINSVFAGVLLDITPEISNDGTITLRINPSISEAKGAVSADNSTRSTPPDLNRRQLSSVVTVKDGNRVVLGGLITSSDGMDTTKVPLLGDIPVLGYLFKQETKTKTIEELVIVIEPHIIKKENDELTLADLGYTGLTEEKLYKKSKEANE
jgi:general secretion pathway protein D